MSTPVMSEKQVVYSSTPLGFESALEPGFMLAGKAMAGEEEEEEALATQAGDAAIFQNASPAFLEAVDMEPSAEETAQAAIWRLLIPSQELVEVEAGLWEELAVERSSAPEAKGQRMAIMDGPEDMMFQAETATLRPMNRFEWDPEEAEALEAPAGTNLFIAALVALEAGARETRVEAMSRSGLLIESSSKDQSKRAAWQRAEKTALLAPTEIQMANHVIARARAETAEARTSRGQALAAQASLASLSLAGCSIVWA
jgi:hypothetical protein